MTLELSEYIYHSKERKLSKAKISLSGMLEAFIGNYFVYGDGIDDDFMKNEKIPFDFDSFALIDEGVHYLNPKHFSVSQLVRIQGYGS